MRILALALVFATSAAQAQTAPIVGVAHAADGDSLVIGDTRIRLYGIDAPELSQQCQRGGTNWACGERAKLALQDMVADRPVTCVPQSTDKHGRVVAVCSDQYGEVNVAMVELGWATAYSFHTDRYEAAQASAKAARKGIWDGEFVSPRDYRVMNGVSDPDYTPPAPVRPKAAREYASNRCDIKGNHSRRGEWIYYLPGMEYYDGTRAEAFFCSEADARKAGYRRSRGG